MRPRDRFTPFGVGLAVMVLIAVAVYFAFAKDIPFTRGTEIKAVFNETSALGVNSPVRIAGVEVGKVSKVEPAAEDATASVITMKIKDEALPLHTDARLKIRPRIFLEGNFFVDVRPGTPSEELLSDGDVIPATQTAAPVQLDQVLGTLKANTRKDLKTLLQGYGGALAGKPRAGEDADQDPDTQGETGGKALNDSLEYSGTALRDTSIVNDALRGSEVRDLSRLVAGLQKTTGALASRETTLKELITNFNETSTAFADEQDSLRRTVRVLPEVLEAANPALDELNAALPPTRAFAREIIPAVRETPATIAAALPWIAQTRALVSPAELQGLVRDLQPAVADLARATDGTVSFLPQVDLFNRCLIENLLPTGDDVIADGPRTTGVKNYKEFFQGLVGLSGESSNFDGNGAYTRFQVSGGTNVVQSAPVGPLRLFGNATRPPLGTRPARPAKRPPYNRNEPCHTQRRPDLDGARTGGGP